MQDHGLPHPENQSLFLSAVHQARQPLLVLEYALFAANQLAQRLETSPVLKLIQQSLTEMGAAVNSLTSMISVIAEIAKPETRKPVETELSELVKESFEMASFSLRRNQGAVNYELGQSLSELAPGTVLIDYPKALIALIRWILDTASKDEFRGDTGHSESLTLSAFSEEGKMIIQIRTAQHQQRVRLDAIISAATNTSTRTGE